MLLVCVGTIRFLQKMEVIMKTYTVSVTIDTKQKIIEKVNADSKINATQIVLALIKDKDWKVTGDLTIHTT